MKCYGFMFLFFMSVMTAQTPSFLVQEKKVKKYSTNTLKEMIAETARDLFKHTIGLTRQLGVLHSSCALVKQRDIVHKELGALQIGIADIQHQCSLTLEKLLDNAKPFKNATKKELTDAYDALLKAEQSLADLKKTIDGYQSDKQVEYQLLTACVQSGVKETEALLSSFQLQPCLKIT